MGKILVVDDEQHIRECYALELSEEGHEVHTAASCYNLLRKIKTLQPDAVVLDIRLVDCDGLEMLALIRDSYNDIPVIICSAYDSYRYDRRAIAADYYVIKSFDLTELKAKLARALQTTIPVRLSAGQTIFSSPISC